MDFEQLETEGLDLDEHAIERRLVGQGADEQGLAPLHLCGQAREGPEQPLAQNPADADLVAKACSSSAML
jgi:hypothetical protein